MIQPYRKWLKQICRNGLCDTHRYYASAACRAFDRERSLEDDELGGSAAAADRQGPAADSPLCAAEMSERMDRSLAALPEDQRDAFLSHVLRGETFARIGRRWSCCASTALAAYRRACHRLAGDLADG